MSTKVKRKVTVENSKETSDHPRRPSVFERLGPGAVNVPSQSRDRTSRVDQNEKCRNWLRTGDCVYGNSCCFQHDTFQSTTSRRSKSQKDINEKDLRHKMRSKRDETKGSRTGSVSPKRKESKRSRSRSRKGEHESKIKSTVVVTRPRSPAASQAESSEKEKKKADGSWEDDSDDWPMDATQLDYKEELTLERKRQQLQRELELELQKERMLNEKRQFSESSSSSSSSDSGSISSSSGSSSSSSDEDSDESSSSSSSSSSSASRAPVKKKYKKAQSKKEPARERDSAAHKKPLDDYDKIKSSRAPKPNWRPRSPASPEISIKKGRDRKNASPQPNFSPKRRGVFDSGLKPPAIQGGRKGPRTPSPSPVNRKQRQWGQSSSADSRSAETRKNRSKKHKKKKDGSRADRSRMDYAPTPPPLSSPNRTALQPLLGKKVRQRDDSGLRAHHRVREQSPLLLSRIGGQSNSPTMRHSGHQINYPEMDRFPEKQGQLKSHGRKSDDGNQLRSRKGNSKERLLKHSRLLSPNKDSRRLSISPTHNKYDSENLTKRIYSPLTSFDKDESRRKSSLSPVRRAKDIKDRRKVQNDPEKRRDVRDISPRPHDNRRENQYRNNEGHRKEESREAKKGRDDKVKDRGLKERNLDHESWSDEPKKNVRLSDSRRPADLSASQSVRGDRTRDRKKGKERDTLIRSVDDIERDRPRSSPTIGRVPSDLHTHHAILDDVSRGRLYEPEIPPDDRDYAYSFVPHHEQVYLDDHSLAPEYDVPPLYPPPEPVDYPPPVYPESRYRRDGALKAVTSVSHIERISYSTRDISPLGPRDPVGIPVREEDFLTDLSAIDDRRTFDERWSRPRPGREDWDPYAPLPSAAIPPHVVSELDEDRYGRPRRRRASPEWLMRRGEERDIPLREPRSRSPQHRRGDDVNAPNRGSWGEHGDRHSSRNSGDMRQENQQKTSSNQDDRKNRNSRRDRRDRSKRVDESSNDTKLPTSKEKISIKRPHSPSPVNRKDAKKRKEDTSTPESLPVDNKSSSNKKIKEEPKTESKSSSISHKIKIEPTSPKPEVTIKVEKEKNDTSEKSSITKNSSKHEADEKRKTISGNKGDDDFSDWSDGDDDLLNRDDFAESESNSGERVRSKTDESKKEKASKPTDSNTSKESEAKPKRDSSKDSRIRTNELKAESRSRTTSKERDFERLMNYSRKSVDMSDRNRSQSNSSKKSSSEAASTKTSNVQSQSSKENNTQEPVVEKRDKVDNEDFATTENDDYDPISDEELEALIDEPDDSLVKADGDVELKIVDALDINWSTLMNDSKPESQPGKARNRFKAAHVLSRIGFSQSLAGSALSERIVQFCQKQIDEEKDDENQDTSAGAKKFVMAHPVASFHVSLTQKTKERQEAFNRIGSSRRALCARQDLHIRKLLCRPATNLLVQSSSCIQQYNCADTEPNTKSPEKIGCSTPIANAAC